MKFLVVSLVALIGLAACSDKTPIPKAADESGAQEAGYLAPPTPDALRAVRGGWSLAGSAPAGGRVRLATPAGEALFADADTAGRWAIAIGPLAEPRLYGLSVALKDRSAQAEGYVVVTSQGQGALLRAGAGARRIDRTAKSGIRAIDFDRGGGVEVSAIAPPGSATLLHIDGRLAAQGQADASGHYDISLPTAGSTTAIRPGSHTVQVSGDGFSDTVGFQVSPAAPLAQGPARSQITPAGLRIDWLTPGGGVQSTLLIH